MIARFLNKYSKLTRSPFARNTFTIASGTATAQLIPIIATPILSRLYFPEYFGLLGLYVAVSGFITIFFTFRYSQAVMLCKTDEDAKVMANMCLWFSLGFAIVTFLIFAFTAGFWASLLHNPGLQTWLYLVPLSAFLMGLNETYAIYANRLKRYKKLTVSRVLTSLTQVAVSMTIGFLTRSAEGLLAGLVAGQIAGTTLLIYSVHRGTGSSLLKVYSSDDYRRNFRAFKNFPIFSLPSDAINYFSNQLPVFLMGALPGMGAFYVGAYNMSVRLLGLPSQLISGSIGEIFRQRAAEDYNRSGSAVYIFTRTFKFLFLFSILPFAVLALISPWLFPFVLGPEWKLSGQFSQLLCLMFFMRFSISPLSYMVYVAQKQYIGLIMDVYVFLSNLVIFYLVLYYFKLSVIWAVGIYSLNYAVLYLITLYYSYKLSQGNERSHHEHAAESVLSPQPE